MIDPIELSVLRHMFVGVAEEMGTSLCRTAFSPNIKERRDYSCAVFSGTGELVACGAHMPVHLGAMPFSVRAALEEVDPDPGDTVLLNDPYRGGTHLPDLTMITPVYPAGATRPGRPLFIVANRAHHADVGGMWPGSMPVAESIYQEGLRIPPVKLAVNGRFSRDVLRMILANVRTPAEREGDLLAQYAANQTGAARLLEFAGRYSRRKLIEGMAAVNDYGERQTRRAVADLPDGLYRGRDCLESDDADRRDLPLEVKVTVRGDRATVDFTGSAPQVDTSLNAVYACTCSAVMYVFRCLAGSEAHFCAGAMRPIDVIAPEGSILNPRLPAPVAGGNVETTQRIVDLVFAALAPAAPDRIPAASSGTMNNLSIGGWDPGRNEEFTYYETTAGGAGASPAGPGESGLHTHMTNSRNTPVEALEIAYPLRVLAYRLRPGSGGRGLHRGGDGIVRSIEALEPCRLNMLSDRRRHGPPGLDGGQPGRPGVNLVTKNGRRRRLPGKFQIGLEAGDAITVKTPGGGGWGRKTE